MQSIGICTSHKTVAHLNYEQLALYKEAQVCYDQVVLIDPRFVTYQFIRGDAKPKIFHSGNDISTLNSLHVRSTKGREASTGILVRALELCGCDVFDPVKRFSVGYASKLLTTLSRFKRGVGSNTFVAFGHETASSLLDDVQQSNLFPLIAKPVAGKKGKGVCVLSDVETAKAHAIEFFESRANDDIPLLLQSFEEFVAEYRVLVVDGTPLGIVQKVKQEGMTAANAAQGATFISADAPNIIDFTTKNVSHNGVLGVDVAVDSEGKLHIIETNRAPLWQMFEQATDTNVAQVIIERSLQRLG